MQKLRMNLWIIIKWLGAFLMRPRVWLRDRKHRKGLLLAPALSTEDMDEGSNTALGNTQHGSDFEDNSSQPTQFLNLEGPELEHTPGPASKWVASEQAEDLDPDESNPLIDLLPELEKLVATPILPGGESTMEQQDTPLIDQEEELTMEPQDTPLAGSNGDLMSLFTEDLIGNEDLRNLVRDLEVVEIHDLSSQCKDMAEKLKLHKRIR